MIKSFTLGLMEYFCEGASFVRTDDRHSAESFHCFQGLTEDLVLLHEVGCYSKTSGQSNWEALRNESNRDTDTVYNQSWNVDPVWVAFSQIRSPKTVNKGIEGGIFTLTTL
jgi:hypothetical protein